VTAPDGRSGSAAPAPDRPDGPGEQAEPRVVVRDRRRLDPETGQVRVPQAAPPVPESSPASHAATAQEPLSGEVLDALPDAAEGEQVISADAVLQAQLAERTDDLLRLKAEFDNYRRRVDRDRAAWGEVAVAKLLSGLLPALDDADRAAQHGELTGAFRTVVDALVKAVQGSGLERFGQPGEGFDPSRHEALTSVPTPGAETETVLEVYRAGYAHGGRVLRPAQVVVATPE